MAHVGKRGQRIRISCTITRAPFVRLDNHSTPPKPVFAVTLHDSAGNGYVYFGCPIWLDVVIPRNGEHKLFASAYATGMGKLVELTATVKEHKVYEGEPQTVLARPLLDRVKIYGAGQRSLFSEWGNA